MRILLMFVFVSVFMVSIPQTLYSEDTVDCTYCWQPVPRGTNHYNECPVIQEEKLKQARKDQEQDVKDSNLNAELKRFEDKYDDDKNNNGIIDTLIGALLIVIVVIGILRCVRIHPKNRLRFTRR